MDPKQQQINMDAMNKKKGLLERLLELIFGTGGDLSKREKPTPEEKGREIGEAFKKRTDIDFY